MRKFNRLSFQTLIRIRIALLYVLIAFILIYVVIIYELGWADSRMVTDFARNVSRIMYFGGIILAIYKIHKYRKLLNNEFILREQKKVKTDERNILIYNKSGGIIWDIMFGFLLFVVFTTSCINTIAFNTSFIIFIFFILLKLISLFVLNHIHLNN